MPQLRKTLFLVLLCMGSMAYGCGPLRVAMRVQPGVFERLPDGNTRGVDVDLMQELGRRSRCGLMVEELSNVATWRALQQGDVDLVPSAMLSAERAELVDHVPIVGMRMALLVRREAAKRYINFERFNQESPELALRVRGASLHPVLLAWYERLGAQGRVTEAGDLPSALRALEAGRATVMPIYPMLLRGRSDAWLAGFQVWDPWPESEVIAGLAMSRKTLAEPDRQRLRSALNGMVRDGTVKRTVERHFGPLLSSHYRWISPPTTAP